MKLEKSELRDLLSGEAEKERRALKRTILPIAITALVGLFWLGFSGYKVVSLERESSHLTDQIQDQKTELNRLQDNITTANDELAYTNEQLDVAAKRLEEANRALAKVEETLNNIAAGKQDPVGQAERALEKIPNASKSVDSPRAGPSPPFLMAVEDVFTIQGRGTIALGRVERGKVKLNEPLEIVGLGPTRKTVVKAIDMFRKLLDEAIAGDNVGLILEGVARTDIKRGQVLAKPGSIEPHKKFRASISMRTKEEGGRQIPIPTGYRPQFYFRTLDVTGVVKPLSEKEIAPGDKNIDVEVELLLETIAMEQGQRFAIREGGRTVGTGVVTRIIE